MNLMNIVFNVKDRYRFIESKKGFHRLILRSLIRGSILGAIGSYLLFRDLESVKFGAYFGSGLDLFQNLIKTGGLLSIYKYNPKHYHYLKEHYKERGLI